MASRWAGNGLVVLAFVGIGGLGACSDVRTTPDLPARDVYRQIGDIDLSPRVPLHPQLGQGRAPDDPSPRAASYVGKADGAAMASVGTDVTGAISPAPEGVTSGYQLNFENAPVASVVKAVLGNTLGLNYEIDPRVQGSISLSFERALDRQQVLFALENALRLSNAVMIRTASGYRVIPGGDALGQAASSGPVAEPGYGVSAFPLRYVSAPTMLKLMDGFTTRPGAVRADPVRNMLVVTGTGAERQAAMQTAGSFDADFMRGQSVGIYPLRTADPKTVIGELENVMMPGGDARDPGLLKFQPVDRLNAVLVVTRRPDLLGKAQAWIRRLDRTDANANAIKVYRVRYGEAKHIAAVLNSMFTGGAGAGDATAATAPGTGLQTARSDAALPASGGAGAANGFGGGFGNAAPTNAGGTQPQGGSNAAFGTLGRTAFAQNATGGPSLDSDAGAPEGPQGGAIPGVRVTADAVTNSLLIFASRENYRTIERALQELDRPPLQVAIEATIAEVTLNNTLNYGVQYFLKSQTFGLGRDNASAGLSTNSILNGVISKVLPGANLVLGSNADPRVVLDALRAYTDVKVVSSPSLVVLDNQVATLQVGDQVPIATSSATLVSAAGTTNGASVGFPVANTIDYRNTGVILRVLPRVNYNGNVSLDVEQEISSIVPSQSADTLTPTVSQRRIRSSIAVASEQTVLLAGLISDTQNNSRSGIPIVERLQGIGDLFSTNGREHGRTELIIFIRPRIIRDGSDAADVAEALRSRVMSSAGPPLYAPPARRGY